MGRAAALIVLVILITVGVWYYMPRTASTTVVFYRQTDMSEEGAQTAVTAQPTGRTGTDWRLSIDHITLCQDSPIAGLTQRKQTVTISLSVEAISQLQTIAPSLSVRLRDDAGREYDCVSVPDCTPVVTKAGSPAWRCVLHFPPIDIDTRHVDVLATIDDTRFQFLQLALP